MTSNARSADDHTPRGLRRLATRRAAVQSVLPPQSRVVPPGFAPVLRTLLTADEELTAQAVLTLAHDRAGGGATWAGFRADLERTWLAVGRRPPGGLLDLAAAAWPAEQGPEPEHAA